MMVTQYSEQASEQSSLDYWARVLTEQDEYTRTYTGRIEDGHYIVESDDDNRVVKMDEPDFLKACDKFCELSGLDVTM